MPPPTQTEIPKDASEIPADPTAGSFCSISLTTGLPQLDMPVGRLRGLHLVVKDIEAPRQEFLGRGVEVSETGDLGGVFYAWFQDPDGNTWALQHMPWRP